jgi:hypothetical protein
MSAADLPEAGHASSEAMARVLVTYMSCPAAVRRAIKLQFDRPPCERTIAGYRADYLASLKRRPEPAFKPYEGHNPTAAQDQLDRANARFLAALAAERRRSQQFANPAWRRVA